MRNREGGGGRRVEARRVAREGAVVGLGKGLRSGLSLYPGGLDSVGEGRGLARVDEEEDLVVPGLKGEGGCGEGERERVRGGERVGGSCAAGRQVVPCIPSGTSRETRTPRPDAGRGKQRKGKGGGVKKHSLIESPRTDLRRHFLRVPELEEFVAAVAGEEDEDVGRVRGLQAFGQGRGWRRRATREEVRLRDVVERGCPTRGVFLKAHTCGVPPTQKAEEGLDADLQQQEDDLNECETGRVPCTFTMTTRTSSPR